MNRKLEIRVFPHPSIVSITRDSQNPAHFYCRVAFFDAIHELPFDVCIVLHLTVCLDSDPLSPFMPTNLPANRHEGDIFNLNLNKYHGSFFVLTNLPALHAKEYIPTNIKTARMTDCSTNDHRPIK